MKQFAGNCIKIFIILIITLIVLILLGGLMIENAHKINNAAIVVKNHHMVFMIWRYLLMLIFIAAYPKLIYWFLSKNKNITSKQIIKLSRRRYAIIFCLFYELVIVHNALSFLINGILSLT
jgi:hypothetical protein